LRRAALAAHDTTRVLFIETEQGNSAAEDHLREQLAWANVHQVVRVDRIPMDRRHNAKVDYPALASMVKRLGRATTGP
ncbi:MAG: hypothetical protein H7210_09540, partial [Pyrinomonadaceae bacterium]|nr:hypothetical protein [Phycisphaerales bacterium]